MNELFRNTDPHGATDIDIIDHDGPIPPNVTADAQAAFEIDQRIKGNMRQMRTLWVSVAEDLYAFQQGKMWEKLGVDTFEEWLAGPDVDLARRTVFGMIEVWRELVVKRGATVRQLSDVPISKLRDVMPAVRRGYVDLGDAIADCRVLSRDGLRERYAELSTVAGARRDNAGLLPSGPVEPPVAGDPPAPRPEPQFDATREPEWAICHACGSRYRVTTS